MTYIAHIEKGRIQTCSEHCRKAADYAEKDLSYAGLGESAYLAGLLHDCGKFTPEFNDYIKKANAGIPVQKGSVIHTFAGVYYLMKRYHNAAFPAYQELTAELLSYAVGAHHGLFDCYDEDSKNGYIHRLNKQPEYENRAIENFQKECAGLDETDRLFKNAVEEITAVYQKLTSIPNVKNDECRFYAGMIARLLTSAVINGDRRDTAEFMSGTDFSTVLKNGYKVSLHDPLHQINSK